MDIAKDWKNMLLVEYANDEFACDVLDGIMGDDKYRILNGLMYLRAKFIWLKIQISSTKFCKKHMIPH